MDVRALPDEDLVSYIRAENSEAYAEVVSRYQDALVRYSSFMIKNEFTAHELVCDAFVNAYRDLNSYSPRLKFSSYLYRTMHHTLSEFLKKQRTSESFDESESFEEELRDLTLVEGEERDPEIVSHVLRYARHIPLLYRDPLVLHFIELKSYNDISDILQIPVSSVESRIVQGKNMLRKKHGKK